MKAVSDMDRLEQLRRENEKLSVDSVKLDKILAVFEGLKRPSTLSDLRTARDAITKIIDERDGAVSTEDRYHQQDIRMRPMTR